MVATKGIKLGVFIINSIIDTNLQAVKSDYSTPPKGAVFAVTALPV